jgi:Acyl-CoA carboxylase epsilon subunit
MSGTSAASDQNETNHAHEPHIHIEKGRPTDAELAALIAVLGCVGAAAPEPTQPERTRWGLPVDRLRFAMSNYQRLTLQQMTHMRQ